MGKCIVKDDMQEIYQQMLAADGILWATPVYFWSMTGQMGIKNPVDMERTRHNAHNLSLLINDKY